MKTIAIQKTRTLVLALLMTAFCAPDLIAQQIIRFKSGSEYRVIITRQTPDTVSYQLISSPDVLIATPMSQVESITPLAGLKPVHTKAYWDKRLKKYSRVTIAGGVLLGSGAILTAINISNRKNIDDSGEFQQRWGMNLLGTACVITGTVLTISGGINVGICKKELRHLKVELEANPVISGVTVRVKF